MLHGYVRMQVVEPPKEQNGRWGKPDGNSWVHRYLVHYRPVTLDISNQYRGHGMVTAEGGVGGDAKPVSHSLEMQHNRATSNIYILCFHSCMFFPCRSRNRGI
jgi:hypothetical protein